MVWLPLSTYQGFITDVPKGQAQAPYPMESNSTASPAQAMPSAAAPSMSSPSEPMPATGGSSHIAASILGLSAMFAAVVLG